VRGFDLVVNELGADDRFQDDRDGFWNHGGHLLVGQCGAVGNGFVLARGVEATSLGRQATVGSIQLAWCYNSGMDKAIREKRAEILRIMGAHGARNPRIFGSVARGQDQPSSDIDVLVEMEPGRTLLDLVGLEQDLGATLGRHVDVVTDGGISPYLRDRIVAEAVPL
jgi:predicted nucleotidyltransferase